MATRLASILLWSVIAAAFIGPGTVTTATKAGAEGGWAYAGIILLAGLAGYQLMEMTARVTSVSGQALGPLVRARTGSWLPIMLFVGVGVGCVAYEAGNLLGGLKGLQLLGPLSRYWVAVLAVLAAGLLYTSNIKRITNGLAIIVAIMGICFLVSGILAMGELGDPPAPIAIGVQRINTTTIIGLLGTTIVPYNFFIAAGLGRGRTLSEIRLGLGVSFSLGVLITLGILLTGSLLGGIFIDFQALSMVLENKLGSFGPWMLAVGLLAAGLSSAITAPLALALAGRGLLGKGDQTDGWSSQGRYFRLAWATCLGFGLTVALLDLNLIGVIFTAQVVNGVLLPFVAGLVLWLANDRRRLGNRSNAWWQNAMGGLIFLYLLWVNGSLLLEKLL